MTACSGLAAEAPGILIKLLQQLLQVESRILDVRKPGSTVETALFSVELGLQNAKAGEEDRAEAVERRWCDGWRVLRNRWCLDEEWLGFRSG